MIKMGCAKMHQMFSSRCLLALYLLLACSELTASQDLGNLDVRFFGVETTESPASSTIFSGFWSETSATVVSTYGISSPDLEVDQQDFGALPSGVMIGRLDGWAVYCDYSPFSCIYCGICADSTKEARGVGLDKVNGITVGYYLFCSDGTVTHCSDYSTCTQMFSGTSLSSITYGNMAVEYTGHGSTSALILAGGDQVWRCPASGSSGTYSFCQSIGGNFPGAIRTVDYALNADGSVESYILGTNTDILKCWAQNSVCQTIASGLSGVYGTSVARNSDGTTIGYMLGADTGLTFIIPGDDTYTFTDTRAFHGVSAYLVTTTTTTKTTITVTTTTTRTKTTTTITTSTATSTTSSTSTSSISSTTTSTSTSTTTTTSTSTSSSSSTTTSTSTSTTTTTSTSTSTTTTSSTSTTSTSTSSSTTSTSSSTSTSTSSSTTSTTSSFTSTTSSTMTTTTSTTSTTTLTSTSTTSSTKTTTTTTTSTWTATTTTTSSTTSSTISTTTSSTSATLNDGTGGLVTTTTVHASVVYCSDDDTFSDHNGLGCSDWSGVDCSEASDLNSEAELEAVREGCPVSCAVCPPDSIITTTTSEPASLVETMPSVSFEIGLDFDTGNTSEAVLVAGLNQAFSTSMGVPTSNVATEIYTAERLLLGSEQPRSLAGGRAARCEIIVPASSTSLSIVKAATSLTADSGSSATFTSFADTLSSATGVSAASIVVQKKSACTVGTTTVVVSSDGTLVGKASATSNAETGGSTVLVLDTGCEDETFYDEQGRDCIDWIGYSCFSSSWLVGQRPYSAAGLLEVQERCLLSCGACEPAGKLSSTELKATCQDDEYSIDFCRKWRGLDCNSASEFGFSDEYVANLLKLCPLSCGNCLDGGAEIPCNDTESFRDEQGYACQEWVGYSCTSLYSGYSELGMLNVQANCQESCSLCNGTYKTTKSDFENDVCEDDPNFLIAGSLGCDYFVGKSCTYSDIFLELRWLLGPAGTAEWHQELWSSCPVACGLCDPDDRISVSGLLLECQDDTYLEAWCESSWEGTDCAGWESSTQLGSASEASVFNETVFWRCPKTCGLCEEPVCGAGTYRSVALHACEACEVGSYATDARSGSEANSCSLARTGFYVDETGSTEESYCEFGTFSANVGAEKCDLCPAGYFVGTRGSSTCEACSAGYFSSTNGSSVCQRCGFGTYQGSTGSSSCQVCSGTFSTLESGSTSPEDCVCAAGYYFEAASQQCETCPLGFECYGGAKGVDAITGLDPTLKLRPGMMSLASDPMSVYSCIAGESNCPGYRQPGTSQSVAEPVCQSQSRGVRCGYCNDGFYLDAEEGCLECPKEEELPHGLRMVLVTVVLVAGLYESYVLVAREDFPPKVMACLVIQFFQELLAIDGLPIHWPEWMLEIFRWCDYFNIFKFFGKYLAVQEECLFGDSVSSAMARDMLKPLLPIPLFIPLAIVFRLVMGKHLYIYTVIATLANWVSGVFIQISLMVLFAFPTERMPNGKLFLTYYPRIEQGSTEWQVLLPLTFVAALVYVAGFLSFVAWGIKSLPKLAMKRSELADMFSFFGDHRPCVYWWIGVALAYQFFFALANAVVDNEFLRVYLTLSFVFCVIMIEIVAMPGLTPESQRASVTIQLGLLLLVALGTSCQTFDEVDMEEQKRVVGLISAILIWAITVLVFLRFAMAVWHGRHADAVYEEKRQKILAKTLTWMKRTLAEDVKDTLSALENLDYCDERLLRSWTLGMRGGVLGMAPKSKEATLHAFLTYMLAGHRLIHQIKHKHSEATSTSGRWREALQIQMRWADELRGRSPMTPPSDEDVTEEELSLQELADPAENLRI